jgi:hypothetical protein
MLSNQDLISNVLLPSGASQTKVEELLSPVASICTFKGAGDQAKLLKVAKLEQLTFLKYSKSINSGKSPYFMLFSVRRS